MKTRQKTIIKCHNKSSFIIVIFYSNRCRYQNAISTRVIPKLDDGGVGTPKRERRLTEEGAKAVGE